MYYIIYEEQAYYLRDKDNAKTIISTLKDYILCDLCFYLLDMTRIVVGIECILNFWQIIAILLDGYTPCLHETG